jgi:hypothetical protein
MYALSSESEALHIQIATTQINGGESHKNTTIFHLWSPSNHGKFIRVRVITIINCSLP